MVQTVPYRVGAWLPSDQAILDGWLSALIEEVDGPRSDYAEEADADDEEIDKQLHPVIQEFKRLIKNDAEINMFFHQMFSEVPKKPPYNKDPTGNPQVKNYHQMLRLVNCIMTKAPEFNETGLVGFPINAILDWSMGTTGGYAAFLNDKVNQQFKKILDEWGTFLKSEDSRYVLNDHPKTGWFGEDARKRCHALQWNSCSIQASHTMGSSLGMISSPDNFEKAFARLLHLMMTE